MPSFSRSRSVKCVRKFGMFHEPFIPEGKGFLKSNESLPNRFKALNVFEKNQKYGNN
jgi:hypothetical protein